MTIGIIWSVCFGVSALATLVLTGRIRRWLVDKAILDIPNTRSSHRVPLPRGGGLAMTISVTVVWFWAVMVDTLGSDTLLVLILGLLLAAISWWDDRIFGGLSAGLRLGTQCFVVGVAVATLPADSLVLAGWLPWWLDRALAVLAWLWFINLFNFMDGIDGMAGVEVLSIAMGLAALPFLWPELSPEFTTVPLVLAGAAAGFLVWNWYPAKIFMGDVGSISMGFWLGWLLIHAAISDALIPAIILPMYFIADATVTLLRRIIRREAFWQAHRSHFYQVAICGFGRHDAIVFRVVALNLALIAITVAWTQEGLKGWQALLLAGIATSSLLFSFAQRGRIAK